jgi:hypothetical protein
MTGDYMEKIDDSSVQSWMNVHNDNARLVLAAHSWATMAVVTNRGTG